MRFSSLFHCSRILVRENQNEESSKTLHTVNVWKILLWHTKSTDSKCKNEEKFNPVIYSFIYRFVRYDLQHWIIATVSGKRWRLKWDACRYYGTHLLMVRSAEFNQLFHEVKGFLISLPSVDWFNKKGTSMLTRSIWLHYLEVVQMRQSGILLERNSKLKFDSYFSMFFFLFVPIYSMFATFFFYQ